MSVRLEIQGFKECLIPLSLAENDQDVNRFADKVSGPIPGLPRMDPNRVVRARLCFLSRLLTILTLPYKRSMVLSQLRS